MKEEGKDEDGEKEGRQEEGVGAQIKTKCE